MMHPRSFLVAIFCAYWLFSPIYAQSIRVGLVQTTYENTLEKNLEKILHFISQAKESDCKLVVFPESALYLHAVAIDNPSKGEIDAALEKIREKAQLEGIYVMVATQYKDTDAGSYYNKGYLLDTAGKVLIDYKKNWDVPRGFSIEGVPMNMVICSDRWYLEHSDLPALTGGSRIIIDVSGGHGGDDGRPDLRWIRYRPWALRTHAFVLVSNPVTREADFMGNQPYGGGSAVIRPDGTIQASYLYEEDLMLVEDIGLSKGAQNELNTRRNHPIFKSFWEAGQQLNEGIQLESLQEIIPYSSPGTNIRIAAIQMDCSRSIEENVDKMIAYIEEAAQNESDIVVFPELAVTGKEKEDIMAVDRIGLENALSRISTAADDNQVHVIAGMPFVEGNRRTNCAVVFGPDGLIKTRYAQLHVKRGDLFVPGHSTKAMWFQLNGVYAIVTIGDDAEWVEIADLATLRGMALHFHISNELVLTENEALLSKQKHIEFLKYARYGAVVNASHSLQRSPSEVMGGGSMIVSREGGHNLPAPAGLEYYLPYETSIVTSASTRESVLYATRKLSWDYPEGILHSWRIRTRKKREQQGWNDWITKGLHLIETEVDSDAN